MRNNITSPVTGNDFYGRERELKEAMRLLESNQSIILSAPRRVGKSSLAIKIKDNLDAKGIENIFIDGYLCRELDRRKFCSPLIREWWKHHFA